MSLAGSSSEPVAKRVAIIGAGASGLTAIKCCLDEGLVPVCFEKSDNIGGLWYYRVDRDDQACVYESTVINTSKETMCFSDFPIPADFPNFMHNRKVLEYFHLYCDRFKLRQYIRFHTKVDSVFFADDFQQTGKWKVTTTTTTQSDDHDGKTVAEVYDAVLVCTGHHCTPNIPEFRGVNEFKGKVLHTHDYLTPTGFENKRIVVVGVGNSACDAAVELARCAAKLYLSTRRGTWILHRIQQKGIPGDLNRTRAAGWVPVPLAGRILKNKIQQRVDHEFLGVQPTHSPLAQHPTVNDFLPNYIINGSIIIKPDIERFTPTGVMFKDGTEYDIDVVILGTGYVFRFPFIKEEVVQVTDNQLPLYEYVFPPDLPHPTMAFIGYIQPRGAINPISEMQSRWATRVFKGVAHLPSRQDMGTKIEERREAMARRYVASPRHTIQVDFIPYMDDLANQIGVRPDFRKMLFRDPVLALKCVFGPFTPYQYRLTGPGQWSGARETIIKIWERVRKPLRTSVVQAVKKESRYFAELLAFIVVVAAAAVYCFWL